MKSPLFLLFFCVVGYPQNWGKRPRYIDRMKKFSQLAKKKTQIKIFLSSIKKTKAAVKFPKKNKLSTESRLGAERVKRHVLLNILLRVVSYLEYLLFILIKYFPNK